MRLAFIAFVLFLAGCATTGPSEDEVLAAMLAGRAPHAQLTDKELAEVQSSPLGSEGNPVRAEQPRGERAYLERLRCPNGVAPSYNRRGSTAYLSPYGAVMDIYEVRCGDSAPVDIYIDMYHPNYVERSAVNGFTIVHSDGT